MTAHETWAQTIAAPDGEAGVQAWCMCGRLQAPVHPWHADGSRDHARADGKRHEQEMAVLAAERDEQERDHAAGITCQDVECRDCYDHEPDEWNRADQLLDLWKEK